MGDYNHKKVLRIPAGRIMEAIGVSDLGDLQELLLKTMKQHCFSESKTGTGFEVTETDSAQYLDYVLSCDSDLIYGEFGIASYLSQAEKALAWKIFNLLDVKYNPNDIHYVEYCCYKGTDAEDCYDVEDPRFSLSEGDLKK